MEKSYNNLINAYKNCGDNGEFKKEFKVISPILIDLPIKKVFVDYCYLYEYIDIIMNIGNGILLTIGVNKGYDENKDVMFSLSKDNKLIMIDAENIKYIIESINNWINEINEIEDGSTCKKDN